MLVSELRDIIMNWFITIVFLFIFPNLAFAGSDAWVKSDILERRTCPNTDCGEVGRYFFREGVTIYERRQGWVRVSKYYNASCRNGFSEFVDSGNTSCVPKNGIINGKFAEWVEFSSLSSVRPADPALGASGDYAMVKGSDDYIKYKEVFASSARKLISQGKCKESDFIQNGGWIKSSNYRDQPIYFTYCGAMRRENKLYLNAESGKVTR